VQTIFYGLIPIGFGIFVLILWFALGKIYRRKFKRTYFRNAVATFMVFIFLMYPIITSAGFEMFNCVEVEGVEYLKRDFTIECWGSYHMTLIFTVGLPIVIVWVAGFPLVILFQMWRHKEHLSHNDTLIKYGLYYVGLNDSTFFWEVAVINLRKVLIIIGAISLQRTDKQSLALGGIAVLYLNVHMTRVIKPYHNEMLNNVEIYSNLAGISCVVMGLLFLEPQTTESESLMLLLFLIIIFCNGAFMLYWVFHLMKVLFQKGKSIWEKRKTSMASRSSKFSHQTSQSNVSQQDASLSMRQSEEGDGSNRNLVQVKTAADQVSTKPKRPKVGPTLMLPTNTVPLSKDFGADTKKPGTALPAGRRARPQPNTLLEYGTDQDEEEEEKNFQFTANEPIRKKR